MDDSTDIPTLPAGDQARRFLFDGTDIRGECVQLDSAFGDILAVHQYAPGVGRLLGELLAAAVLAAARGAFPGRRLVLAFQPHRYTRTRDCFEDFVRVMGTADAVLLTEVYAAGEAPIVAADGRALARALRVAGKVDPIFADSADELCTTIAEQVRDGDVVIAMGAGSIGTVAPRLSEQLGRCEEQRA